MQKNPLWIGDLIRSTVSEVPLRCQGRLGHAASSWHCFLFTGKLLASIYIIYSWTVNLLQWIFNQGTCLGSQLDLKATVWAHLLQTTLQPYVLSLCTYGHWSTYVTQYWVCTLTYQSLLYICPMLVSPSAQLSMWQCKLVSSFMLSLCFGLIFK